MTISSVASTAGTAAASSQTTAHAKAVAARAFEATIGELNSQIDTFESESTWRVDHGQDIAPPTGVTAGDTTAASATSAAKTISDGFSTLETDAQNKLANLTPDEQKQFSALQAKLAAESTRFQGFIARRASTLAKADHHLDSQDGEVQNEITDFEKQVTWQIDHGDTVTAPSESQTAASGTAATAATTTEIATGSGSATSTAQVQDKQTLAQTIADGFAAIESNAASRLKNAPWQFQAESQQFQKSLNTEAARFASFATRRAAYRAANPKAQQDTTA